MAYVDSERQITISFRPHEGWVATFHGPTGSYPVATHPKLLSCRQYAYKWFADYMEQCVRPRWAYGFHCDQRLPGPGVR